MVTRHVLLALDHDVESQFEVAGAAGMIALLYVDRVFVWVLNRCGNDTYLVVDVDVWLF